MTTEINYAVARKALGNSASPDEPDTAAQELPEATPATRDEAAQILGRKLTAEENIAVDEGRDFRNILAVKDEAKVFIPSPESPNQYFERIAVEAAQKDAASS